MASSAKKCLVIMASLLMSTALLIDSAQAQRKTTHTRAGNVNRSSGKASVDTTFQHLDRPMELPGVPNFSGNSKFQFGLLNSNYDKRGGTSVALRYSTPNSAEDVIKFYHDSLPPYRWTLLKTTGQSVSAKLNGNTVNIIIMPRSSKEFRTDFYVTCLMPRR